MANTIQNLFPATQNKGVDFVVQPRFVEFSAPIIGGQYVFSESTTPAVVFGKLPQGQTGIIAGVMISANCENSQFTRALSEPLELQILHGGNNTPVNISPFSFTEFSQGDNFSLQWAITSASTLQEEDFKLSIRGKVDQLTGMTQNELILKITFNFIRVGSKNLRG
ncbi:MAG: hypothetical protein J5594_05700 [Elusimicrobiaceae bacterium]|nr:hypothetical protein [Elusimicrobiaceae bacterium]MBR4151744.1 hypothetical protein [Selenomonadaceae bacterium]